MHRPVSCSSLRALVRGIDRFGHPRTLFSLPDLSGLAPWNTNSEAQKYHERKILPYGQKELYEVVADVGSYHHFLPFCTGSRVVTPPSPKYLHEKHTPEAVMEAELTVGFLTFTEKYVSQVRCKPYESVEAIASTSTPLFKTLTTTWRFQSTSGHTISSQRATSSRLDHQTLVTLDLVYAFANPIHASVSSAFFGQVSKLMVKAFEDRCSEVYGPRST